MLNNISSEATAKTDILQPQKAKTKQGGYAKKIILASKGEAGYFKQMDLDEDGILTLEEFNKYCEEHEIDEKEKLKLLSIIQNAKKAEKMAEDDEEKETDKSIYARKGDKKYDEKMDKNKDSKVTYQEYLEYCQKRTTQKIGDEEESDTDLMVNIEI